MLPQCSRLLAHNTRHHTQRRLCSSRGPYELPPEVRASLTKQLKGLYPKKTAKVSVKGDKISDVGDSRAEDMNPVKSLDMQHIEGEGLGVEGLQKVLQHEDLREALGRRKRDKEGAAELQRKSGMDTPPEGAKRGMRRMKVWEAKQLAADGDSLLEAEKKRSIPLSNLDPADRVSLYGRAPLELEGHNQLDVDSLAFVLSTSLDKSKSPWERGNNPYDKTRLKVLLEKKITLDKLQARLSEIEAQDDTKLGPEYNYLRLKGRHMFHTYLDELASLRKDLIEGLVEESSSEWNAFESHETKRIERIIERNRSEHLRQEAAQLRPQKSVEPEPEPEAEVEEVDVDVSEKKPKKKKQGKKKRMMAKEKRFRRRMEREEVAAYMQQMHGEGAEDDVREMVQDVSQARTTPFIWGTLPPTKDDLEYHAQVSGSRTAHGWNWQRPVYYIPRIPWREAEAKRAKASGQPYPFTVDDTELPLDWEENYRHFPYYRRQELWENPKLLSTVPSTEADWPEKDKDFLQVYLSSKEFVHPGDWDVKLGKMKQSRYKTLQKSIFQDKFTMSPYENRDFEQFMMDPTKTPPHRLGLDMLGF